MIRENNEMNVPVQKSVKGSRKKKKRSKLKAALKIIVLLILTASLAAGGTAFRIVSGIVSKAPEIDTSNILATLSESSVIVDESGNIIEQIHDPEENREIVSLDDIPPHLQNAFIAIEDQRFKEHFGIDIKRIIGSLWHNFRVGDMTSQGASTITQQMVRNLYLSNEKSWERKIVEAYLAIKVEKKLSKEQILEIYLNTIPLGQSSYGVQAAAYTYFSKDAGDLTLAESALLAGAAKSTSFYAPFKRYSMDDINDLKQDDIVGYVYIDSVQYACVYNQNAVDRQHIILGKMLELELITQKEYDEAMSEDMCDALRPGQKKIAEISSTPMDYVKKKVIEDLMEEKSISYDEALKYLYRGGLKITTTIDVAMQESLETSYKNFSFLFLGSEPKGDKPAALDWKYFKWEDGKGTGCLDKSLNVLNENGQLIYYAKANIIDENGSVYLNPGEFSFDEHGNLSINSKKFYIYPSSIDIVDCYTINSEHYFVSHSIGALNAGVSFTISEQSGTKGTFTIPKEFLDENKDMFMFGNDGILRIPKGSFFYQEEGIVQPQSSAVIMDYRTGKIKAIFGGRDIEGSMTFNRATDAVRQPGSAIKPLSVYLPALESGYSAAYVLNDIPRHNEEGERWPKNWYEYKEVKYWGRITLRKSVEQSINTNSVNMLEILGTDKSISSLVNLGLINTENPGKDTFISPDEDAVCNDVNLASLGLGGLTKGFSPLSMTAAYGAIANDGIYVEPICYMKVTDKSGNTILNNVPETHQAASPEASSLLVDILRSTVYSGLSYRAKLPEKMGIEVAGKTGTTQSCGDFWFVGFSPYYIGTVWVGNDNVQMKLSGDSGYNARLWSGIMAPLHENLAPAKFELNKNLVPIEVCRQSGKLATTLCSQDPRGSQVISEYFIPGTEPSKTCTTHVAAEICTNSGLLKSGYCPGNEIVTRIFTTRYDSYDPEFPVLDQAYQIPSGICTNHTEWHYDQWMKKQRSAGENSDNADKKDGNKENENNAGEKTEGSSGSGN